MMKLQVKRISENARMPTRGSAFAAGYDVYASAGATVPARGRTVVKTGIQIALPPDCYGRIAPRSGLAVKHGIDVGAGVIDQDYRGEVGVVLFNFGDQDFEVKVGDRVAQLICEKIFTPVLEEVEQLDETVRGEGGFGSTGINKDNEQLTERVSNLPVPPSPSKKAKLANVNAESENLTC